MNFIDTNILLHAATPDGSDGGKLERARALLARGDYAISGQVHAEFYADAARKIAPPLSRDEALGWLARLRRFPVVPVTGELVARGAEIAERYRISYWDGAIVRRRRGRRRGLTFQ